MKDLLFNQERTDSLGVQCPYCSAEVGDPCVNPRTAAPIENQAAHWLRLVATRPVTS